jgi:hypothetical protein
MAISVESDLDDHKYGISICFEGQDEELRLRSFKIGSFIGFSMLDGFGPDFINGRHYICI